MTGERVDVAEEARALLAKATPGPWRWFGNLQLRQLYLATTHSGRRYVMGFRRWGMGNAQPQFQSESIMRDVPELVERGEIQTKEYGCREVLSVSHPDMLLIERAPELLSALLAENAALRARVQAAEGEVGRLTLANADLRESEMLRKDWLRAAKASRGYDDTVSFDVVWSDMCSALDAARGAG